MDCERATVTKSAAAGSGRAGRCSIPGRTVGSVTFASDVVNRIIYTQRYGSNRNGETGKGPPLSCEFYI